MATKKATRPRTQRRAAEEARRRLETKLGRLAEALPGGSPERPLQVVSASVIEVRAKALPCLVCQGELELTAHTAAGSAADPLRCVELLCRSCRRTRRAWFRVARPLAN
ncbi:MAG TPA: hypothetical protein VHU40_09670 [Polyangia bacterium]|jgi:hypothetical protein|nr:hypothetical protein [Polyangia bacterium]